MGIPPYRGIPTAVDCRLVLHPQKTWVPLQKRYEQYFTNLLSLEKIPYTKSKHCKGYANQDQIKDKKKTGESTGCCMCRRF